MFRYSIFLFFAHFYIFSSSTYVLVFDCRHERRQPCSVVRVWICSVTQQYFQTVDVFGRHEVDRATEEVGTVGVGAVVEKQFGEYVSVVLDGQLQRLLGQLQSRRRHLAMLLTDRRTVYEFRATTAQLHLTVAMSFIRSCLVYSVTSDFFAKLVQFYGNMS